MKFKKFFIILLFIMVAFTAGCNAINEPNKNFIVNNAFDNTDVYDFKVKASVPYSSANFTGQSSSTLFVEKDAYNFTRIYSALKHDFVYSNEKCKQIYLIQAGNYYDKYIVAQYDDYKFDVYDFLGNPLVQNAQGSIPSISVTREKDYVKKDVQYYKYYETVSYNDLNGNPIKKQFVFKDNNPDTRKDYENDELATGKKLVNKPAGIDLETIGLKGYYLVSNASGSDYYQIYNEKGKLVANIYQPSNATYNFVVDGNVYYQYVNKLDDNAKKFDYISNGVKYEVITHKINLKNGVDKEVNLNYIVKSFSCACNKKEDYSLSIATIQSFEDGFLGATKTVVIDGNGKIKFEFARDIDTNGLEYVGGGIVIDYTYKVLYKNGDPIFDFTNNQYDISFVSCQNPYQLFVVRNAVGKVGVIDANLKVVVPFNCTTIDDTFSNGYMFATNSAGDGYLITKKGNVTKLEGKVNASDGLLFRYEDKADANGLYTITVQNYKQETLFTYKSTLQYGNMYDRNYSDDLGNEIRIITYTDNSKAVTEQAIITFTTTK